jgi:poly-beta-1,6-N-acetyl-D-glucosamine synthase
MLISGWFFWLSLFVLLYSYVLYGLVIFGLVKLKKVFGRKGKAIAEEAFEPEVTLVVSAFNEEDFIEQKIQNTLELDYPRSKLKLLFVTDGSTDQTAAIVSRYKEIRLLHESERRGKSAAMNRSIPFVTTPYVIFSDANTLLNEACVRKIVAHYHDERVGGVAGEKRIITGAVSKAAGAGEGLYWKYESFLKSMDSAFYSVVGAAGELFSLRTELYEPTGEGVIIEDFVQSLTICRKGWVVRYEPGAYAMEEPSLSVREEEKRKIRICAGAFQAMVLLKDLFNVFKYPVLSFQFISHRILRWTLCPLGLPVLFIANLFLLEGADWFYRLFFLSQLLFYVAAFTGWILANRNIRVKALFVPYYFLFMNISVYLGFARFLRKRQSVLWERAARQQAA